MSCLLAVGVSVCLLAVGVMSVYCCRCVIPVMSVYCCRCVVPVMSVTAVGVMSVYLACRVCPYPVMSGLLACPGVGPYPCKLSFVYLLVRL